MTRGGDGMLGWSHSQATKDHMRSITLGHKRLTPESKILIGKASKGRNVGLVRSDETKRRISVANKGKKRSDEHNANHHKSRSAGAGWAVSVEEAQRLRGLAVGLKRSESHRLAISKSTRERLPNNTTGLSGVLKRGKRWVARYTIQFGPRLWLGTFLTKEEAHEAYLRAEATYSITKVGIS